MNELDKLRAEIDILDNELLKVLGVRFTKTRRIGEIKKLNNLAATDELRHSHILQSWKVKATENSINAELAESVLFSIHGCVVKEHEETAFTSSFGPSVE